MVQVKDPDIWGWQRSVHQRDGGCNGTRLSVQPEPWQSEGARVYTVFLWSWGVGRDMRGSSELHVARRTCEGGLWIFFFPRPPVLAMSPRAGRESRDLPRGGPGWAFRRPVHHRTGEVFPCRKAVFFPSGHPMPYLSTDHAFQRWG